MQRQKLTQIQQKSTFKKRSKNCLLRHESWPTTNRQTSIICLKNSRFGLLRLRTISSASQSISNFFGPFLECIKYLKLTYQELIWPWNVAKLVPRRWQRHAHQDGQGNARQKNFTTKLLRRFILNIQRRSVWLLRRV